MKRWPWLLVTGLCCLEAISLIACPMLSGSIFDMRAASDRRLSGNAAHALATNLNLAKLHARRGFQGSGIRFKSERSVYQMLTEREVLADGSRRPYTIDVMADYPGVHIVRAGFGGTCQVRFDERGTPSHAGAVVFEAGDTRSIVLVDESGNVTVN